MAVQKSKSTRSRRGMRRSHDRVMFPQLKYSKDKNGVLMVSMNHHMNPDTGEYRGRSVVEIKAKSEDDQDE